MTIIPVYNRVITPHSDVFFQTDHFRKITGKSPEKEEQVIFLFLKDNETWDKYEQDSFYPIGVSGVITEVNPNGFLVVKTADRINISSLIVKGKFKMELAISKREDIEDLEPQEEQKKFDEMRQAILDFVDGFQWGAIARGFIGRLNSIGDLTSAMSIWFANPNEEK